MTPLHAATIDRTQLIHAAFPGDGRTVCGRALGEMLGDEWDTAAGQATCPRCREAVAVLVAINAL